MLTSRIGRKPVIVPMGVDVKLIGQELSIKGPKGHQSMTVHPFVHVNLKAGQIDVSLNTANERLVTGTDKKLRRAIAGTARATIYNIVQGVTQGFSDKLVLIGVGYRAQMKGKVLSLSVGFSHPTDFPVPEGITIETPSQTEIIVKGVNRELVGQVAATIRSIRPPEPYKGKGIRYADEIIVLKETKKK